ncbi:MAG: hypothetical protein ACRYGP_00040 [Janthinobacterium lividum]
MFTMNTSNPVDDLVARATEAKVSMAAVCKRAGVAASTPSRWRGRLYEPTFKTLRRLEAALDSIIADRALALAS